MESILSEKRRLGEYDRLRLRRADSASRDFIYRDGVVWEFMESSVGKDWHKNS